MGGGEGGGGGGGGGGGAAARFCSHPLHTFRPDQYGVIVACGEPGPFPRSAPDRPAQSTLAHVKTGGGGGAGGDDVAALIITPLTTPPTRRSRRSLPRHRRPASSMIEDCAISVWRTARRQAGGPCTGCRRGSALACSSYIATYFGGANCGEVPGPGGPSVREQMVRWPQMTRADLKSYLIKGLNLDTLTQPLASSRLLTFSGLPLGLSQRHCLGESTGRPTIRTSVFAVRTARSVQAPPV